MRWPEDLTLHFVKKYLEHTCLWDNTTRGYKDRAQKVAAYKDIIEAMDLPDFGVDEVKSKIKNIRSTYSQELGKIKKAQDKGGQYVPQLKWFELMHSSLKVITLRNNLSPSDLPLPPSTSFEDDDDNVHQTDAEDGSKSPAAILIVQKRPKKEKHKSHKVKRVKKSYSPRESSVDAYDDSLNDANWDPVDPSIKPKDEEQNKEDIEDEFDLFGKYISAQLKNIPFRQALEAQHHIQSFLTQFRLNNMGNGTPGIVQNDRHFDNFMPTSTACTIGYEKLDKTV